MSMAVKYGLMKRAQKSKACEEHGMPDCEMCHGGMMAEGGEVDDSDSMTPGGTHRDLSEFHNGRNLGMSAAGAHVRGAAMAKKAGQHRAEASRIDSAKNLHREALDKLKSAKRPHLYAEGGEVDDSDIVDRIMNSRKGEPVADFENNDFDYMDETSPGAEGDYTGTNSGDEIGNAQEDEDQRDIVARIMRSRAKKDRMPRPA